MSSGILEELDFLWRKRPLDLLILPFNSIKVFHLFFPPQSHYNKQGLTRLSCKYCKLFNNALTMQFSQLSLIIIIIVLFICPVSLRRSQQQFYNGLRQLLIQKIALNILFLFFLTINTLSYILLLQYLSIFLFVIQILSFCCQIYNLLSIIYLKVKIMCLKLIVLMISLRTLNALSPISSASAPKQNYPQNVLDVKNQLEKTFGPAGVCGIMGNIAVEAPSFDYTTKQVGGNGYGLFQLDFLKKYYFTYLTREKKTDSMKSQIDFMISTLKGKDINIIGAGVATKVLKALNGGNVETATVTFMKEWEKPGVPHQSRRIGKAKEFYEAFYAKK